MSDEATNQFNSTTSAIAHEYVLTNDLEVSDDAIAALQQITLTQLSELLLLIWIVTSYSSYVKSTNCGTRSIGFRKTCKTTKREDKRVTIILIA